MPTYGKPFSPDTVQRLLRLAPKDDAWREGWGSTQAEFDAAAIHFFDPVEFRRLCKRAALAADATEGLVEALTNMESSEALQRLVWHYHARMFRDGNPQVIRNAHTWPAPSDDAAPGAACFFPIVLVSGVETVYAFHRAHGIGEQITYDTLTELDLWMREYRRRYGHWGFKWQFWLVGHYAGDLYRLGRLNFRFDPLGHDLHVYRRRADGAVAMFPADGAAFRRDGQYADADGQEAKPDFIATFSDDGQRLKGHPIGPRGQVVAKAAEFDRKAFDKVLERDTRILTVHIPDGSPMDFAACREAMNEAMLFFPKHFPERPFAAFGCTSWLLDPQLEDRLSDRSNIRKFLMEYFLHPITRAGDGDFYERIFGWGVTSLGAAPRNTSLQRIVAEHIEGGGHWRTAGGIILRDDLDWGAKVYRQPGKAITGA